MEAIDRGLSLGWMEQEVRPGGCGQHGQESEGKEEAKERAQRKCGSQRGRRTEYCGMRGDLQ